MLQSFISIFFALQVIYSVHLSFVSSHRVRYGELGPQISLTNSDSWHYISDFKFGKDEAYVICRELSPTSTFDSFTSTRFRNVKRYLISIDCRYAGFTYTLDSCDCDLQKIRNLSFINVTCLDDNLTTPITTTPTITIPTIPTTIPTTTLPIITTSTTTTTPTTTTPPTSPPTTTIPTTTTASTTTTTTTTPTTIPTTTAAPTTTTPPTSPPTTTIPTTTPPPTSPPTTTIPTTTLPIITTSTTTTPTTTISRTASTGSLHSETTVDSRTTNSSSELLMDGSSIIIIGSITSATILSVIVTVSIITCICSRKLLKKMERRVEDQPHISVEMENHVRRISERYYEALTIQRRQLQVSSEHDIASRQLSNLSEVSGYYDRIQGHCDVSTNDITHENNGISRNTNETTQARLEDDICYNINGDIDPTMETNYDSLGPSNTPPQVVVYANLSQ